MGLKESLKESIEGTGEVAEALISATTGVVKEGTHDVSDVFKAVIDLSKDGAVDVAEGVKSVFVGSVNALKETGKTTEQAVGEVTVKAEQVIGEVSKEGEGTIGGAAKKGIEEAKEIIKAPLNK